MIFKIKIFTTDTEKLELTVGLKRTVTYTNISPKMVNPRDIAGECRRRNFTSKQRLIKLSIVNCKEW